jgi:hypothetical protein
MPQFCWTAHRDGSYWIDALIGNQKLPALVDLGLIDPSHLMGAYLDPSIYDHLEITGGFLRLHARRSRDASGQYVTIHTGLTTIQLLEPQSGNPAGPIVPLYVGRGAPGIPSRIGVAFFHRLSGGKVIWDLTARTWTIEF